MAKHIIKAPSTPITIRLSNKVIIVYLFLLLLLRIYITSTTPSILSASKDTFLSARLCNRILVIFLVPYFLIHSVAFLILFFSCWCHLKFSCMYMYSIAIALMFQSKNEVFIYCKTTTKFKIFSINIRKNEFRDRASACVSKRKTE